MQRGSEREKDGENDDFFLFYFLARNKASPGLARVLSNVKIVGQNIESNA